MPVFRDFGYDEEKQRLIRRGELDRKVEDSASDDECEEELSGKYRFWTGILGVLVIIVISAIAVAYGLVQSSSTNNIYQTTTDVTGDGSTVDIVIPTVTFSAAVSVAGLDYSAPKSLSLLPWDAIAEMHKDQIASLEATYTNSLGETVTVDESTHSIEWNIFGNKYLGINPEFQVTTKTGVSDCYVTVKKDDDQFTYEFTMAAKYIRREIRSLTDDDRNKFLDALKTMYTVPMEEGQKLYGSKYVDASDSLRKHLYGAGRTDCDHWHDGAGILTHHMAFTLEVEQALQTIDPSIAMPYWEYARDGYDYKNWWESEVFQDDWFGIAAPGNDENGLDTGRWADVRMPLAASYAADWDQQSEKSLNPFTNSFGIMRSPWNNNPSMKIGRHNLTYDAVLMKMPDCGFLSGCFHSKTLTEINDCLNDATHGPVHILIGGTWGQGDVFDKVVLQFFQGPDKLIFFKNLWRMGFSRCPTTCDTAEECACSIPDEYFTEYGAEYMLKVTGIYDLIQDKLHEESEEFFTTILRAMEDPAYAGEMFSSASSYDPIFWPTHGTLERLLTLKRVYNELNQNSGLKVTFNETWGFETANTRYLQGICDWSGVQDQNTDLTLPTCDMDPTLICDGHNADDLLEFGNFLNEDETYTNSEFFDFIHPWSDDLPYIYDEFSFDYCSGKGYDFST